VPAVHRHLRGWRYDKPLKTAISNPLNLMPESASTSEITSSCYCMLLHGKQEDPLSGDVGDETSSS
jgi:hypothetical protein